MSEHEKLIAEARNKVWGEKPPAAYTASGATVELGAVIDKMKQEVVDFLTSDAVQISPDCIVTALQLKERLDSMELEAAFHEWLSIENPQLKTALRPYMRERMANERGMTLK